MEHIKAVMSSNKRFLESDIKTMKEIIKDFEYQLKVKYRNLEESERALKEVTAFLESLEKGII